MNSRVFSLLSLFFLVSACVSADKSDVLQTAINDKPSQDKSIETKSIAFASDETAITQTNVVDELLAKQSKSHNSKTYLINGLASSAPSIGYGFTNLSKKIPDSNLYNYASFIESSTIVRARVTREIKEAYKADPNVEINLIGISFGANIVTWIAEDLNRKDIPIHYLATMEGPAMSRIHANVKSADNFSCTNANCFKTSSKLSKRNKTTEFSKFKIKSGHIALANHPDVHERILVQINQPLKSAEEQQVVAE